MTADDSVTEWIAALKGGDETAAEPLLDRYFDLLVRVAREKLGSAPRRVEDEEDVALSVLDSLCRGAAEGRFRQLTNRNDLWWLLLAIATQKTADQKRRTGRRKRGAGRVFGETEQPYDTKSLRGFCLDNLESAAPTPEFLTMLTEQHQRLMARLRDDRLRRIAQCKMDGYSNTEIALELAISTRSIERKLRLIRAEWSQELQQ